MIRLRRSAADETLLVVVEGLGIQAEHCVFANLSGKCTVSSAESAAVTVNGTELSSGESKTLTHNDRVRVRYSLSRTNIVGENVCEMLVFYYKFIFCVVFLSWGLSRPFVSSFPAKLALLTPNSTLR